ncbi:O-antigen ligase [Neisseria sp.]|uniref:O-antigen ligase family protein n=1 Tax=Neisseria sp. TaxID=192066 RepID=UPI0026DD234A|nr:O-antigen ligase family protein [Neisseria sp.]MDO4906674.1 O-antigen ligase family protein [Neisseria sp.]
MKIKTTRIYTLLVYGMLGAYMLGPAISYFLGVQRVDNLLTILFIICTLFAALLESKRFPTGIAVLAGSLAVMAGWSALHLVISPLTGSQFVDLMFFLSLPCFFYLLYQIVSRSPDPLGFIQRLILFFAAFVCIPPFIEIGAGVQFVTAIEELALEAGAVKGLFFNPNNLATTAVCLTPAVLVFFTRLGRSRKEVLAGWGLFALLGLVILASVSRTAIACYAAVALLTLLYRKNGLATVFAVLLLGLFAAMIPPYAVQDFLLSLNSNEFLERFSTRVYLFLYDFGSDNSVSSRQEIYNHFWNHTPALFTGYGPKNFGEFFGGHLGSSLGFENPHSFIIELYLGFGIVSLLSFLLYAAGYAALFAASGKIDGKIRMLALVCMGVFLIGGFIPSSILRLPFIWLPCFMLAVYFFSYRPSENTYSANRYKSY